MNLPSHLEHLVKKFIPLRVRFSLDPTFFIDLEKCIEQTKFTEADIKIVSQQSGVSWKVSFCMLRKHKGDIVEAIMELVV